MAEEFSTNNTEKKEWKNRHVVTQGIPVFSCVESYEEKSDKIKHISVDEDTYNALQKYKSTYSDDVPLQLVAGDIISDACDKNWKPFDKPQSVRINFKHLTKDITVAMTKSDTEKMKKLSEACGIKTSDFMRFALSWKLVMSNDFSKKPF